jgi:hypothetical protein
LLPRRVGDATLARVNAARALSTARGMAIAAVVALALASAPRNARADVSDECIAAAEQAQPLRHDGKLRAARERLRLCTRPACPSVIRADCTRWLADVEGSMPTVVVHATEASGKDLVDVRVLVDGEVIASGLDGRDIAIDPGPHVLRFEHAGADPVEQHIVVDVGAQHRLLTVTFGSSAALSPPAISSPALSATPAPNASAPSTETSSRRSPLVPLLVAGAGIVAAAVGGVLWAQGLSQCRSSVAPGAPSCTSDQIGGAHTSLVAGDVLVSGGAVVAVAGLVLWLVQSGGAAPASTANRSALIVF